jgi:hypothetical protein
MARLMLAHGSPVLGAVLPAAMLLALLVVLLFPRRGQRAPRTSMRLVASSLWSLDHLCAAMPSLLREWPELREIRVELGSLRELDEASAASMICAIGTVASAGVEIRIDGCDARMAEFLLARGVDRQHLGSLRNTQINASETVH